MKKLIVLHVFLLIVSYYLIYIGLVGIGIPINYGYVPATQNYQPVLTGDLALGIVLVGVLLSVLTYYHMEEHHEFKFKVMGKRHCEKTSFLWVFFAFLTVVILYLMTRQTYPIQWVELSAILAVSGYIGVLYYRAMNHKKIISIDSLKFWSAKS